MPPSSSLPGPLSAALLALAVFSPIHASGATVTLLEETFPAGERTVESLPGTAAWWGSGAATLSQPNAGSIVASQTGSSLHLIVHFAPAGSPYSLALDETLNVSLDFNLTKAISGNTAIRLGVLNSQNTRVAADGVGISSTLFNDDRGYGLFFNPVGVGNNLNLRARTATNGSLFTSATPWTSLINGPGSITVAGDQTYSLLFKITRTSLGADVVASISGGNLPEPISVSYSATTVAQTFTAFDKFGFAMLSTATSGTAGDPALLTVSNVKVTATPPPAPPPPPPPSENNVFLQETFPIDQRTTENLPATAAWYGSNSTLGQVAGGSVRSTLTSLGTQHVFTHFRPLNSPYPLSVGEKITVNFDFNLTKAANATAALRFGLLNSQGTRLTSDSSGVSNGIFSDDRGYGVFLNPRNETQTEAISLFGRILNNNSLLSAVAAWTQPPYATSVTPLVAADNQTYSASLSVRRTETGTLVKVRISGGDLPSPISIDYSHDAEDAFISFDKFAIALLSTGNTGTVEDPAYLTLSNVYINASTLPDQLTAAQLFAAWADDEGVSFPGDANGDGVSDGLAWLLGAATPAANASGLLPAVNSVGGNIEMLYSQIASADRSAARLVLQHSSDLAATWTTVVLPESSDTLPNGIVVAITPDGDLENVMLTIPSSLVGTGPGNRFFVRLVPELEPAP